MVPVNPFIAVAVIITVPLVPRVTVKVDGDAPRLKDGLVIASGVMPANKPCI
jgi:hypothetical protein